MASLEGKTCCPHFSDYRQEDCQVELLGLTMVSLIFVVFNREAFIVAKFIEL